MTKTWRDGNEVQDWQAEELLIQKVFGSTDRFETELHAKESAAIQFRQAVALNAEPETRRAISAALAELASAVTKLGGEVTDEVFPPELLAKAERAVEELQSSWYNPDLLTLVRDAVRLLTRDSSLDDDGELQSAKGTERRIESLVAAIKVELGMDEPKAKPAPEPRNPLVGQYKRAMEMEPA